MLANGKNFLYTFHFLQRRWTWLYDGKNRIQKEDRVVLIQHIRSMVYSKTEDELGSKYSSLTSLEIAQKYPHFLKNINAQWEKRTFWAHCYRRSTITRGNHTNNYAEAGIRILLLHSRNNGPLLQAKVTNNRFKSYVALRFTGLDAKKVRKEDITKEAQSGWYTVRSQSETDQFYQVNVHIGVCTCTKGQDGSPCIHQAAIVVHFGDECVNYIATLSASSRLDIAKLALGDGAVKDPAFYA